MLNINQLRGATGCSQEKAELYLPFLVGTLKAYSINTPRRIAGFLSQIAHESGKLERVEENLNYSTTALISMFGRHRISREDAEKYGRGPGRPANVRMIANILYGGQWGRLNLGNTDPEDGWRHRGMGLKQLTGKRNHKACGEALGEDFVTNPERLMLPVNATLSAGWFWHTNHLNEIADLGDVTNMTKIVNGGYNGLGERIALFAQAEKVLA